MIIAILALLGLVFGSFVNAFVWRLHEQEQLRSRKKKPTRAQLDKFSILKGRSMCPDCRHELAAKDLVPVFSWLSLRGKCRYCGRPISWQYPSVEASTAVLFAISYLYWPVSFTGVGLFQFIVWLGFIIAFMVLTVYDLRWYLLPDRVVYPLVVVAALETVVIAISGTDIGLLVRPVLGALVIAGTFWILFQVSAGKWIGGGDVKLAVVLGLLAGSPLKALLVLFFSSVIGTFCSIPILLRGKKALKAQVPFGPFLLAATVVVVLFGTAIIDWYTDRLLG
jgi:leader peptidase (prepilin peptidase)/N-methyltransferase